MSPTHWTRRISEQADIVDAVEAGEKKGISDWQQANPDKQGQQAMDAYNDYLAEYEWVEANRANLVEDAQGNLHSPSDGTFTDRALVSGCSLNAEGRAEASMGVDAGDYDGDGDLDLFMAHLDTETNTLYRNDGQGHFEDRTIPSGLRPRASWKARTAGVGAFLATVTNAIRILIPVSNLAISMAGLKAALTRRSAND